MYRDMLPIQEWMSSPDTCLLYKHRKSSRTLMQILGTKETIDVADQHIVLCTSRHLFVLCTWSIPDALASVEVLLTILKTENRNRHTGVIIASVRDLNPTNRLSISDESIIKCQRNFIKRAYLAVCLSVYLAVCLLYIFIRNIPPELPWACCV